MNMSEDRDFEESGDQSGLSAMLSNLSAREQMMLKAMLGVFVALALVVVVGLSQRAVSDLEAETALYQGALTLLATAGPAYLEAQEAGVDLDPRLERFSDEALDQGRLQLTSFVATHAAAANVQVGSYDEEQNPLRSGRGEDSGPRITERQLRIDVRSASMDNLLDMLQRIEDSGEAVIIKRFNIQALRDDGDVRARIYVSTFERRPQEES